MALIPGIEFEKSGTTYIVPPLSMTALTAFREHIERYQAGQIPSLEALGMFQNVITAAFRRNYPEMTREQLFGAGHIDETGDWIEDTPALFDVSDLMPLIAAVIGVLERQQPAGRA